MLMLIQIDPDKIVDDLWFVCVLWANIGKEIFRAWLAQSRSRQHCIAYFPVKTCLYALGQHCTSNFFVQCCLRRI